MTDPLLDMQTRLAQALAGQYVIERVLGQGGMGTVYLARDETLDRPVAIKVISPDVTGSAELRQRFLLEARTVARLRHPNIVSVYAAGEADGLLWFAMEFVPGESLRERLQRDGTVPSDAVVAITHDLAMALDDAHAAGIVHRDVKPENILLDAGSGRAMLTDFGVARALSAADNRLTGAGFVLGSPRYMSPEQAAGEETIDGRSDLYSLGLVAYEMVAGRPVVTAETPASILVKHLTEEPTPLRELVPDVPDALDTVIARSLRKAPEERYARGRSIAAVLEGRDPDDASITSGARPRATAKSALPPGMPSLRSRLPLLAGAAVAGVAAVLAALQWMGDNQTADANERAWLVAPFEMQTADASLNWLSEGAVNMLGLTLSQWNDLSVVDYERTLDLLRAEQGDEARRVGLEDARNIARRASAGTVVLGQVTTANDSLFVVARRYNVASGERLDEATAGAPLSGDHRVVFERIARQLLDVAGGPALTVELAQQTTESIEAYRAYLDGIKALNRWQLSEADSLFSRAVTIDSTFALAHYKRSLGLGWRNMIDSTYRLSAERAVTFGARLSARQREIITANRDLAFGFLAVGEGRLDDARAAWHLASDRLATLLAVDSTDAEAWYGYADAEYHAALNTNVRSTDTLATLLTNSLRGFERAIALDSTFHLAYEHLVRLYQMGTSEQSPFLVDGDRITTVDKLQDTSRAAGLRLTAQQRTKAFASSWIAQDPSASQAWQSLSDTYALLKQFDSASATLSRASERADVYTPIMAFTRPFYPLILGDVATALRELRDGMARFPGDSLRARGDIPSTIMPLVGMSIAGAGGQLTLLDSLAVTARRAGDVLPLGNLDMGMTADWLAAGTKLAMGVPPSPALLNIVRRGQAAFDSLADPGGVQLRYQSAGMLYVAYLTTGDTAFATAAASWGTAGRGSFLELDALRALARGDSTEARRIASEFPSPQRLRRALLSYGGVRAATQADVRAQLGDLRAAAETYAAMDAGNMQLTFSEPGLAIFTRSYLARARVLDQLGDRPGAIAAYEEFERRWADADPVLQGERREAQAALARLRDGDVARPVGGTGSPF